MSLPEPETDALQRLVRPVVDQLIAHGILPAKPYEVRRMVQANLSDAERALVAAAADHEEQS